ncbi:MAG: ribosome-associated translation inhibitor RaiA [Gammaproteobacteria bacterium]|nr:ribosome-associated translation inhibitor RaiA [Gammaproteobacteria bacterium]MYA37967.1 ribosome-associated translation inhibitor RaiA [Gammaproteobacteria bacterium]MYA66380.1 ribosome-associated translation inhibitor RaiA [Gammaproteobacteria bacterium]MYC60485.1 ribosome-associated translation inhibitor RaiA [Gammaproteobacteria bacterium]MYF01218.1 ribosome-associated translation inhibitor RaiA [Gammaproteobacteria bacterium]
MRLSFLPTASSGTGLDPLVHFARNGNPATTHFLPRDGRRMASAAGRLRPSNQGARFMNNEFQIFFHNIDQTEALQEAVRKRIAKLERYCERIISGRVVLDSPHNHRHKGKVYSVGLEIHTPQKEVRVNQEQHDNHAHEDLYVAIRDAFNAAERQLKSVNKSHRP